VDGRVAFNRRSHPKHHRAEPRHGRVSRQRSRRKVQRRYLLGWGQISGCLPKPCNSFETPNHADRAGRFTAPPPLFPTPPRRLTFTITSSSRTSAHATMESATPKKPKSNLLAALDLKPGPDNFENYYPPLTQAKRKQTPGSPDPRQPKRVADAIRSNVPGLENVIRGCLESLA